MIVKDLLPPTLVTFIKGFLHAIIANEHDAQVMKSFVFAFWCHQTVTNFAHIESQIHPAHAAWMFSQREVGHGLDANSKKGMH